MSARCSRVKFHYFVFFINIIISVSSYEDDYLLHWCLCIRPSLWNHGWGASETRYFWFCKDCETARLFGMLPLLDLLLYCWIEHITMGLLNVKFVLSPWIFDTGSFRPYKPYGVVALDQPPAHFWKYRLNYSWFLTLIWWRLLFVIFYLFICVYIYRHDISWYENIFFFALFLFLNSTTGN